MSDARLQCGCSRLLDTIAEERHIRYYASTDVFYVPSTDTGLHGMSYARHRCVYSRFPDTIAEERHIRYYGIATA
ncbi:hypothetical protein J6590_079075 [Homalodisca vitripennis]|nr:hypothetical protein J6590_079075 [Homalodisca vitripennis]